MCLVKTVGSPELIMWEHTSAFVENQKGKAEKHLAFTFTISITEMRSRDMQTNKKIGKNNNTLALLE